MRALIIIALIFSSIAIARADSSTGCGLGSMNHSFSSQLFGITTGTSGCSQHSIVKRDMYPVYYAEANMPELRYEMAMGQGEYLATFAQVLGCTPAAQAEFMVWAKQSYGSMFPHAEVKAQDMLKGLGQSFKQTSIARSCDNLALI